jgi:hypothetical protein
MTNTQRNEYRAWINYKHFAYLCARAELLGLSYLFDFLAEGLWEDVLKFRVS